MKDFVGKYLDDKAWEGDMESYMRWLIAPPKDELPNHLKLYWWILKFWKSSCRR